jgi:hypothetical protein
MAVPPEMFFPKPILPNRLDEPPSPFLTFNYGWDNLLFLVSDVKKELVATKEPISPGSQRAKARVGEGLDDDSFSPTQNSHSSN